MAPQSLVYGVKMPVMYKCSNCGKLLYYYPTKNNGDLIGVNSVNDVINFYMGVCPHCGKPLKSKLHISSMDVRATKQDIERKSIRK